MGLHIKARRKTLGLSQTALADAIGLTFQQIQKYERGANRVSFSKLVEIAHALDCRVINLIGDLDEALPQPAFRRDTAQLRAVGAPDLLAAYVDLPQGMRRRVLEMVQSIARDQPRGRGS
jgi:transcriptional regulator with XRE-family HTH domain